MKKIILLILFILTIKISYSQERIRVPMNMLLQIKIPIQPDDKSWVHWNVMPSLQDSTKTIRIDRMVQGYAPFIPRNDAPYYSAAQVKEIQISLEKILNPDGYFLTQEEFMVFYREFNEKFVYIKTEVPR
jgi:hypothetical protein